MTDQVNSPESGAAAPRVSVREKLFVLLMRALDPICRWGERVCPVCFSMRLYPFTVERSDEPRNYFCNGCNTIWPARVLATKAADAASSEKPVATKEG